VLGEGSEAVNYQCIGTSFVPGDFLPSLRSLEMPPQYHQWLDDFSALAEHHFITAADDTHSLLNMIIELIEMCEGNIEEMREVGKKLLKAIASFKKMFAETGNFWLSWNFAIKPSLKDFYNLANSLENARKRLKWLRNHNHLDTKVKYRQGPLTFEATIVADIVHGPEAIPPHVWMAKGGNNWFQCDLEVTIVPAATGWVRFDIPDMYLDEDFGLGIIWSALNGLYNPLKVAWEAVPFSWLIDWFVNMRTRLQLEAANLSPLKDAQLLACGYSLTTKAEGTVFYCSDVPNVRSEVGKLLYKCYNRRPELPHEEVFPFRIPLEWYNFSILLALVQQKHRR
jgi:hypothetical protein